MTRRTRIGLFLWHMSLAGVAVLALFQVHQGDYRVKPAHVVPWVLPVVVEALLAIAIPTKGYALATVGMVMIATLWASSGDIGDDGLFIFYWFFKAGGLWVVTRASLAVVWKITTGSFDRDALERR